MDKKDEKSEETTLVDDINYKLSYKVTNQKTKYSSNSVFISLICKLLYLIGKLLNCIIFSIIEIFINLVDAKESSETIEISSINKLNIDQIKEYIYNNYYVKSSRVETINRDKLLKDLVVFKAYKEDLEINIKNEDLFTVFMTLLLNITSIVLNLNTSLKLINSEVIVGLMIVITIILAFSVMWLLIRTGVKSDSSRLKVVNYGIHTLEAIKEDMVEVSEDKAYKLVAKRFINEKPDECLDPNIYYVMFMESLEDKSK